MARRKSSPPNTFETSLKTAFDNSPICTQIFSPDGKLLIVNKAWKHNWPRMLSLKEGHNILQSKWLKKQGFMKYIRRGFRGQIVYVPEVKYQVEGESTPRWFGGLMYPIKNDRGKITHIVLQHRDITRRKLAEEELKERELQHSSILELSPQPMGIITKDEIVYVNQAGLNLMKARKPEELLGRHPLTFVHPDYRDTAGKRIVHVLLEREPVDLIEEKFIALTGEEIDVEVISIPTKYKGKPAVQLVVRDITAQKKISAQKDMFMAVASHELKTPVTTIKAFSQLLENYCRNLKDKKPLQYLVKINLQVDNLVTLIRDLLDITKIQSGRIDYTQKKFRLDSLIRETVDDFKVLSNRHTLRIVGGQKVTITGDHYRIGQVLTNLISNALKYSPEKSTVTVSYKKQKKKVQVSVRDQGVGIPKEQQEKIFEKFFRVQNPEIKVGGLGLGLFISNEIVQRHGGTMSVTSEKGKGSTFTFTLPI